MNSEKACIGMNLTHDCCCTLYIAQVLYSAMQRSTCRHRNATALGNVMALIMNSALCMCRWEVVHAWFQQILCNGYKCLWWLKLNEGSNSLKLLILSVMLVSAVSYCFSRVGEWDGVVRVFLQRYSSVEHQLQERMWICEGVCLYVHNAMATAASKRQCYLLCWL